MADTEEIMRAVIQTQMTLVQEDERLLRECVRGLSEPDIQSFITFLAKNPLQIIDAWPADPPKSPTIVVYPGESEEAEQMIGSVLEQSTQPAMNGYDPYEETDLGTWFSSTHHVGIYSINKNIAKVVSKLVFGSLVMARPVYLNLGLYNSRIIEGPLDIASEWGEQAGTDPVFRRSVHFIHNWLFVHSELLQGKICNGVIARLTDQQGVLSVG